LGDYDKGVNASEIDDAQRGGDTLAWVGDDPAMQESLAAIARQISCCFVAPGALTAIAHDSKDAFLSRVGCLAVTLDRRAQPIIERLRSEPFFPPTIFVAFDSLPATIVEASQAGAVAVLEADCKEDELRAAVARAMQLSRDRARRRALRNSIAARLAQLREGELAVLRELLAHHSAVRIAHGLGRSLRTIEARQARILKTLNVRSLAELVAMMSAAGLPDDDN
jgi:FixJ family two-component response regulator